MMRVLIVFVCITLLLPFQSTAFGQPCSCSRYFAVTAKPFWAEREILDKRHYITQGSAYCSGLKQQDVARADKSARANLTRMIEAQVQSSQNLKQASYGFGVTVDSYTEKTSIKTDLSLTNASVFEHWVDQQNCTVYAAIKMNSADVAKTLRLHKQQQKAKWTNQVFYVKAVPNGIVTSRLNHILSRLSIVTTQDIKQSSLTIESGIKDLPGPNKTSLNLMLTIDIKDNKTGQSLWKTTQPGKGFSYQPKKHSSLYHLAISDALERLTADLVKALITRSTQ